VLPVESGMANAMSPQWKARPHVEEVPSDGQGPATFGYHRKTELM